MLPWIKKKKRTPGDLMVLAPLNGRTVSLDEVPDEAFSKRMMGEGIAIIPTEGAVYSPFDGVVAQVIKSKHALVLEHESGAQVLIHVGMNTVSLKGEGFIPKAETGERVKAGQLLMEFDIERIMAIGLPIITPIIVPVGIDAVSGVEVHEGQVSAGKDPVLTIKLI